MLDENVRCLGACTPIASSVAGLQPVLPPTVTSRLGNFPLRSQRHGVGALMPSRSSKPFGQITDKPARMRSLPKRCCASEVERQLSSNKTINTIPASSHIEVSNCGMVGAR